MRGLWLRAAQDEGQPQAVKRAGAGLARLPRRKLLLGLTIRSRYGALRAGSLGLFAVSCVPMLVMLPAGLVGLLTSVGVSAEAGWVQAIADPLGPVAQPLLIAATLALAAGSLSCGRAPVAAALAGGALLYVGMYVVTKPGGLSEPALFYPGLGLFLANPALTLVRPRVRACRPLGGPPLRRTFLFGTGALAVLLVATAPVFGWGDATAAGHARHAQPRETAAAPPSVRVGTDAFAWSGRVQDFTDENAWFPPMSTDGAVLELRGRARAGTVYVQLMDGAAVIVYEKTFDRIPAEGMSIAVPGARGVWMVTLSFQRFAGELDVTVGRVSG